MASGKDPVTRPNGGSDRSYQIEAEIDRTRAAMDRTVDLIAGKLTPQQLAMEALGVFKDGSSALATKVIQTAREHPVPATIIGIGIGLLLTESRKAQGSERAFEGDRHLGFAGEGRPVAGEGRHVAETMKDKAAGMKETVAAGAMEAKDKVEQAASDVKEQVGQVTEQVRERAAHVTEQVREQAARVPAQARRQWHDTQLSFWQTMDERPFAVGVAALAIGVAAGLSLPASRKEQELMGETRDRLLDQAKGYTREAVDMGKQVARVAADTVKSEVERQGLTPAVIAEKVRTIGREAEQALKSEAGRVAPEPLRVQGTPLPASGTDTAMGGAAGRGMSAGFASTSAWDPDNTVPGAPKPPRT
jgi:hypothetical protein